MRVLEVDATISRRGDSVNPMMSLFSGVFVLAISNFCRLAGSAIYVYDWFDYISFHDMYVSISYI